MNVVICRLQENPKTEGLKTHFPRTSHITRGFARVPHSIEGKIKITIFPKSTSNIK
jgi:hypothetical protein